VANGSARVTQCPKPTGWLGRLVLRNMNSRHSKVTDWGLSHVAVGEHDTVLDVGCGGGRTVSKLAAIVISGEGLWRRLLERECRRRYQNK
jgi:hypothetical protein